jgi:amidase
MSQKIDTDEHLYLKDAILLNSLMASREVSAVDVMTGFLDRIEEINPTVNAICTLLPREEALAMAQKADRQRLDGTPLGPLHGLPIACKDLAETAGLRTTYGSEIFKDNVPAGDCLLVERLRQAGALIIGKTNTPEFGAGSNTFNNIFGTTRNPYNLQKTVGGSSGGAAAALATRMLPIADGSDMGGSLRNPAAFCNVVGFRPSMGRVPSWPSTLTWQSRMGIEGPMARNVNDLGLMLSAIAGPDQRDPISIVEPPGQFANFSQKDFKGSRIGWTPDLGMLTVAREVREVCERSVKVFDDLGCQVELSHPNLAGAMDVFRVLRSSCFAAGFGPLLKDHRQTMKSTVVENTEIGFGLSGEDLLSADRKRAALYQEANRFFKDYDFLVLPSTQVAPFDHSVEWVREIDGVEMRDYLEWMSICCVITILDLPAISIPCGFTEDGLPVGLQIVGKPWADLSVLQIARAFEELTGYAQRMPLL